MLADEDEVLALKVAPNGGEAGPTPLCSQTTLRPVAECLSRQDHRMPVEVQTIKAIRTPLPNVMSTPLLRPLLRYRYRLVARHRHVA